MSSIKEIKSYATPFHLNQGGVYAAARNSSGLDIAPFSAGIVLFCSINQLATAPGTIRVQDSEDGVTYANTDFSFVEPIGSPNTTRYFFVHPNRVRRFIRVRFDGGGGVLTGMHVNALGFRKHNGVLTDVTYSIDTGTGG